MAQTLWCGLHGIASLHITHAKDKYVPWRDVQQRAEVMLDALMRGMLRPECAEQGIPPAARKEGTPA